MLDGSPSLSQRFGCVGTLNAPRQFNNSQDARQISGLRQLGLENVSLAQLLEQNYSDIRNAIAKFRSFTASGEVHVILNRPEFYTVEAKGVRLRDWVADLASGQAVESVNSED